MEPPYDQKAWEQETKPGRRLYIHNFGMTGKEFPGWELVKISATSQAPDESEKIFMWKRKGSQKEELVQVRVIETGYWRNALQYHYNQLTHSMRPDIPRGKGK